MGRILGGDAGLLLRNISYHNNGRCIYIYSGNGFAQYIVEFKLP